MKIFKLLILTLIFCLPLSAQAVEGEGSTLKEKCPLIYDKIYETTTEFKQGLAFDCVKEYIRDDYTFQGINAIFGRYTDFVFYALDLEREQPIKEYTVILNSIFNVTFLVIFAFSFFVVLFKFYGFIVKGSKTGNEHKTKKEQVYSIYLVVLFLVLMSSLENGSLILYLIAGIFTLGVVASNFVYIAILFSLVSPVQELTTETKVYQQELKSLFATNFIEKEIVESNLCDVTRREYLSNLGDSQMNMDETNNNKFRSCLASGKLSESQNGYIEFEDYFHNTIYEEGYFTQKDQHLTQFCEQEIDNKRIREEKNSCGSIKLNTSTPLLKNKQAQELTELSRKDAVDIRQFICTNYELSNTSETNYICSEGSKENKYSKISELKIDRASNYVRQLDSFEAKVDSKKVNSLIEGFFDNNLKVGAIFGSASLLMNNYKLMSLVDNSQKVENIESLTRSTNPEFKDYEIKLQSDYERQLEILSEYHSLKYRRADLEDIVKPISSYALTYVAFDSMPILLATTAILEGRERAEYENAKNEIKGSKKANIHYKLSSMLGFFSDIAGVATFLAIFVGIGIPIILLIYVFCLFIELILYSVAVFISAGYLAVSPLLDINSEESGIKGNHEVIGRILINLFLRPVILAVGASFTVFVAVTMIYIVSLISKSIVLATVSDNNTLSLFAILFLMTILSFFAMYQSIKMSYKLNNKMNEWLDVDQLKDNNLGFAENLVNGFILGRAMKGVIKK